MTEPPKLRLVARESQELTVTQLETLVGVGLREAELLRELKAAERHGDKVLMMQIAAQLCHLED